MQQQKLVLVADDSVVNQRIAVRQLVQLGYRADTVANGREAIAALAKIPYDLVLMDCSMPELSGYETTVEIRRVQGDSKHTPIVAMTANVMEGDREKCIAAGMDDYLAKPVKAQELADVLARVLGNNSTEIESTSPPVDMERLREAFGEDMSGLIRLYLSETTKDLERLATAISTSNFADVVLVANNCAGSSTNCGIVALVPSLRALEQAAREVCLDHGAWMLKQVRVQFEVVERFLRSQLVQSEPERDSSIIRIVMIEDQAVIGQIYRMRFTAQGFAVEIAKDGEEGLDMVLTNKPDLVLLDWNLPKLSGLEVLRQIRSNSEFQTLPIIVFSMSSLAPMVNEARNAGATLVLCKSEYSPTHVIQFVRKLLALDQISNV
jgi:CheY-like chemotaxis protein/HPt (histidine-containing phosphotransfer) domain-containing protein